MRRETALRQFILSADLFAARGLTDGDPVRISTPAREVDGTALLDGNLHSGTVWMNHGWLGRNVNQLFGSTDIDTLTVQPYFTARPVKVEKLGG